MQLVFRSCALVLAAGICMGATPREGRPGSAPHPDDPPVEDVIWYETVGLFHPPLPPGTHELELHAVNTEPSFGGFFEYDNTWTLTVTDD